MTLSVEMRAMIESMSAPASSDPTSKISLARAFRLNLARPSKPRSDAVDRQQQRHQFLIELGFTRGCLGAKLGDELYLLPAHLIDDGEPPSQAAAMTRKALT